jgi:hypothetical protein
MHELKGKKGKQNKKKDIDAVEENNMGPNEKGNSPDPHSDEKLKRTGSADTSNKTKGKVSDPVTKGKVSDDKESRSS